MASSKKLPKSKATPAATSKRPKKANAEVAAHSLVIQLKQTLHTYSTAGQIKPNAKLLLAFSGGLDSTVLLHLLLEAQRTIPFELHALHVHHGLSPNADAWATFCISQCEHLNIPLQVVHVHLNRSTHLGIEAEARKLRYAALLNYQFSDGAADLIVTAHHQDDQAETLLLQLFRGAGVKGLASMASIDAAKRLLRPLLNVPRQVLHDYAKQHAISWCEDESNDNTQFERNFIRHEVMPILDSRYKSIQAVLARTAAHFAEAQALLETLAVQDAQHLVIKNRLNVEGLRQLSLARVKNLLRWWFSQNQLNMPNAEHLAQIIQQLFYAKKDADISIQLQHLTLKRYQQHAYLCAESAAEPFDLLWQGENALILPDGSKLLFEKTQGAGLALKHGIEKLRITNRKGGERFKPNALRPTRTLKYLLQEADIPPWSRVKLPLIYLNDALACVPNIGIAYDLQASSTENGLQITWQDADI